MTAFQHTSRSLPLASLARALWGISGGLFCLGCSDGDLATGYLGDTPELVDPPRGDSLNLTDPWWCLDLPPPDLPAPRPPSQPVGFVLPVVEWTTLTSLAGRGLTATLCPGTLFDCAVPLAAPYAVRDGALGQTALPLGLAGVPVPEGFDGLIKFQISTPQLIPPGQVFIPVSYYLGGRVSGELSVGQAVYLLQRDSWQTLLQQSFPALELQRVQGAGTLIVGVFDCNGEPVNDARVEITVAGGAADGLTPFRIPASRIPIAQPAGAVITSESGLVGYLGVPRGALQLRVFRTEDTKPFGSTEVGVVPGEMSVASLRPAYLNDANLRASPPCCPMPIEP